MSSLTNDGWQLKAACRSPHAVTLFFPPTMPETRQEREDREAIAKDICATCNVQAECLDYALRIREPHGIWGGLTEVERKQVIARRQAV